MIRALLFTCAMAGPAVAQDLAPVTSPKPSANTTRENGATAKNTGGSVNKDEKPEVSSAPTSAEKIAPGMRDQLRVSDAEYAACLVSLDEMGATFTEAAPLIPDDDADCGILRPLTVTEVAPGVSVTPAAMLRCDTALALSIWTRDFVLPASKRLSEKGALVAIENGSGYVCRRRNNLPDGKLSEHAFGNGFDVMAFQFEDGSRVAIEPREAQGSMAEAFQDAVRAAACLDFSTVLGPGSNAAHDDHLHLDIISRNGGYRLCEQGGASTD